MLKHVDDGQTKHKRQSDLHTIGRPDGFDWKVLTGGDCALMQHAV